MELNRYKVIFSDGSFEIVKGTHLAVNDNGTTMIYTYKNRGFEVVATVPSSACVVLLEEEKK